MALDLGADTTPMSQAPDGRWRGKDPSGISTSILDDDGTMVDAISLNEDPEGLG